MKRTMLSLSEKEEILRNLDDGLKVTYLSKKYGIAKSTVCAIKNKKDKIITAVRNRPGVTKRKTLKSGKMPEMEIKLYEWFCEQKRKDILVSNEMLKLKAIHISQIHNENPDFNASDGWLQRFKKRFAMNRVKPGNVKISAKLELHPVLQEQNQSVVENNTIQETAMLIQNTDLNMTHSLNDVDTVSIPVVKLENINVEEDYEEKLNIIVPTCIAIKAENGIGVELSEEEFNSHNVTNTEAIEALNKAILWAEQISLPCSELFVLRKVREKAIMKSLEESEVHS